MDLMVSAPERPVTQAILRSAKRMAAGLAGLVLATSVEASTVTQTASLTPINTTGGAYVVIGDIALASGTNTIVDLTSVATVGDQGWGGYDPVGNDLRIGLFENGVQLWSDRIAGGTRPASSQTYDVQNNLASYTALGAALNSVAWTVGTDLSLRVYTSGHGWSGWELNVAGGSFSVTSSISAVPLPASAALLLAGLGAVGAFGRRKARAV